MTGGVGQLDRISKEQLHSAYKKSTDRYKKYRNRYTEIAARYRDLERENNKARAVLVETQDKALRRISELREQCSLEQQAKAHLESALRLEMDEMQCVIKTLKSKLTNVSVDTQVNSPNAFKGQQEKNGPHSSNLSKEEQEDKNCSIQGMTNIYQAQIAEEQNKHDDRNKYVQDLEEQVRCLKDSLTESMLKIRGLEKREEENTILLANNKMIVHSELEAKDIEVKILGGRIQQLELHQKETENDSTTLQTTVSELRVHVTELENSCKLKDAKIDELETVKLNLSGEKSQLELQLSAIDSNDKSVECKAQETETYIISSESELIESLRAKIEEQTGESIAQLKSRDDQIFDLKEQIRDYENKSEVVNREWHTLKKSLESLDAEMAGARANIETLRSEKRDYEKTLGEEIQNKNELQNHVTNILQDLTQQQEQVRILDGKLISVEDERTQLLYQISQLQEKVQVIEISKSNAEERFKVDIAQVIEKLRHFEESTGSTEVNEVKLKELSQENNVLLLENKRLEQALRAIEGQVELKKKEILCVLDTNSAHQNEIDQKNTELLMLNETTIDLKQHLLAAEDKIAEVEKELASVKVQFVRGKSTDETNQQLQEQLKAIDDRHKEALFRRMELEEKLEQMQIENEHLNANVKQLEIDLQKFRVETTQNESMYHELKDKYNSAKHEIASLQEHNTKFECLITNKNAELVELENVTQELNRLQSTIKTLADNHSDEVGSLKSEINAKQIIINDLNRDVSRHEEEYVKSKAYQLKELQESNRNNEKLENAMHIKNAILEQANEDLRSKVVELETMAKDKETEWIKSIQDLSFRTNELKEVRGENETLKLNFDNFEKILNSKLAMLEEKHRDLLMENQSLKKNASLPTNCDQEEELVHGWEQEKMDMEQRLQKIIAEVQEVSNRNIFLEQKCEDFLVLEQSNERMKLSNEKLSRQLDETLVGTWFNVLIQLHSYS